jgi:hypothetical protein
VLPSQEPFPDPAARSLSAVELVLTLQIPIEPSAEVIGFSENRLRSASKGAATGPGYASGSHRPKRDDQTGQQWY